MKKFFLLTLLSILSLSTIHAQIVSSRSSHISRTKSEHVPSIFVDLGPGLFTGDSEGFGLDLGFRWSKMFHPNVGWDILKISAQTEGSDNFTKALNVQAKTGIRGVTPVLFGNSTLYANFAGGYGHYTDFDKGGFAWEVGTGINFTPRISLGIAYNSCNYNVKVYKTEQSVNVGLLTLRFSYGF